eukprot:11706435-Heterocapsa_arctica.AAC.1
MAFTRAGLCCRWASHGLCTTHSALMNVFVSAGIPASVPLIHDRGPPLVMKANASKQRAYYVYVDNLGGIASEASEA